MTSLRRLALACWVGLAGSCVWAQGDATRGQYIAKAAGCMGCHTDTRGGATPYAGGREIVTPFGRFYGPNITPDRRSGLGAWTYQDFRRALRQGERPDGAPLYPTFPYTSFSAMAEADMLDLWAYLRTLPPSGQPNRPHALRFPFQWRALVTAWQWLFFSPARPVPVAPSAPPIARGTYLVRALGHCGECHTPRNVLGAPDHDRALAGAKLPEGRAPNLTPTRLKRWNDPQLAEFLRTGTTPEGDVPSDVMDEVIRNSTSQLTASDLAAMVAYLRSLKPLPEDETTK